MDDTKQQTEDTSQLDAAGRSLAEALRFSFIALKVIMAALVIIFLVSGFRTVGSDQQALVLRFGKIRGLGEKRLLGPGLHWIFPYPIEEIVKIGVEKKVNLPINSFWYYQRPIEKVPQGPKDTVRIPEALNPVREGYCITRGEKQHQHSFSAGGSDYNIVHSKWQLTYKIDDPERFFKNIYIADVKPGQSYAEVAVQSITPLLEDLVEDAVVTTMVHYTIDEAISSQQRIPEHVKKLLQTKLVAIESGIEVVSVQLTDITWPRQVDYSFQACIMARQASQTAVSEAKGYAEETLNQTCGFAELFKDKTIASLSEEEKRLLWSRLAGTAAEKIAQARAYRTKVVEDARASSEYLQQILPEYRKRPKLVIQKIYQDAIEHVLDNADEKWVVQPTQGTKGREIRLLLNRDPAIKPKSSETQ